MKGLDTDCRINGFAQDLLRRPRRDFFDFDASFGTGHEGRPPARAVDDHSEVKFTRDGAPFFDEDAAHLPACGTGLMGDQLPAEQASSELAGLLGSFAHFYPAGLAPATGVDLSLHDANRTELAGNGLDLLRGGCHFATWDGHAIALENFFRLKLMNIHRPHPFFLLLATE